MLLKNLPGKWAKWIFDEMASGDRGASAGVDKLKEPCTNAAD